MEKVSLSVTRYRDRNNRPTCAKDFKTGEVCKFYTSQNFGTHETCFFAARNMGMLWEPLQRRDNGKGTLIPLDQCPIWTDEH